MLVCDEIPTRALTSTVQDMTKSRIACRAQDHECPTLAASSQPASLPGPCDFQEVQTIPSITEKLGDLSLPLSFQSHSPYPSTPTPNPAPCLSFQQQPAHPPEHMGHPACSPLEVSLIPSLQGHWQADQSCLLVLRPDELRLSRCLFKEVTLCF